MTPPSRSSPKISCGCRAEKCSASTSTRNSPGSVRRWPYRLRLNGDLHAPVLLPPLRIVAAVGFLIRGDGLLRAESLRIELHASQSAFRAEPVAHGARSP